jgi:hypothetical protein
MSSKPEMLKGMFIIRQTDFDEYVGGQITDLVDDNMLWISNYDSLSSTTPISFSIVSLDSLSNSELFKTRDEYENRSRNFTEYDASNEVVGEVVGASSGGRSTPPNFPSNN